MANHDQVDPMRWVWRGVALLALVVGWVFIAWQNSFHIGPPTVFVCLAYLALVGTIYNLFRTGAVVAAPAGATDSDVDDSTWGKPVGALGELEREKKTLLKAIKEAEFDHEMGKLSQVDADQMIAQYRARAIEVIKEIERLEGLGGTETVRDQIEREVRARLAVEVPKQKGKAKAKKQAAKQQDAAADTPADKPADKPAEPEQAIDNASDANPGTEVTT